MCLLIEHLFMELVFVEKHPTVQIKQLITLFFSFFKILDIDLTGNNVTLDEPIEVNWS